MDVVINVIKELQKVEKIVFVKFQQNIEILNYLKVAAKTVVAMGNNLK